MKILRNLLFAVSVCLLFAASISAQQTATAKKIYQNVEIEKFTIRQGVEFPADKIDSLTSSVVNTLNKSKRFDRVSMSGAATATEASEAPTLKISGEIIKYVKGNRAVRYMVGMGMGATKLIADVKFVDAKTGEVVHQQTVDGDVTWGLFGGDSESAKSGLADEIMRIMKKSYAGEKKK